MDIFTIFFIAVALAMDAFAVSLANGMIMSKTRLSHGFTFGLYFGAFQFLMPIIGWFLGMRFASYIEQFDHWIAFLLLAFIGTKMIKETFGEDEAHRRSLSEIFAPKNMVLMAVATSIDAMAVGVGFAVIGMEVLPASCVIGVVAFLLSSAGVFLGKKLGSAFGKKVERLGGVILILIGLKILVEHLHHGWIH